MPLITEKTTQDQDPVRPGEQWFCYWQTSPSLWEGRILETPAHEVLFVPVNWGLHSEGPGNWDFGRLLPERDLFRLYQLMVQHRRKFCWLLPLSPAPFLPNGGVPVVAARTLSISSEGVHLATLDQSGKLNKMYSYFEPKVFQGFVEFLGAFGKFLGENKIKAPVWGCSFLYQSGEDTASYLEDHSLAFEQGFSRYLKQNFKEGVDLSDPREEGRLRRSFTEEVQSLFRSTAEAALAPFWAGVQEIVALGGSPLETIERSLADGRTQLSFVSDVFGHHTRGHWITSSLLRHSEKGEVLSKVLSEHFGSEAVDRRYHYQITSGELSQDWSPFGLIDIFEKRGTHFRDSGLLDFLDEKFRWTYGIHRDLPFTTEWIEENQHKVKLFQGGELDRTRFGQMMKLFMMGQRVVLDKTNLAPELEKRLQIFYLENNLRPQAVNFLTSINLCELGEGRFITYDGSKLNRETGRSFWPQLFRYFGLEHLDLEFDEDVFALWKIRSATPFELNYLDVRRVSLYNPTSYKKKVQVHNRAGFAFMKMIDPSRAKATSHAHGVEVELLPNGRIGLDFGHYEEG